MKLTNFNKLFMKLINKDFLEKMLVEVVMILMSMFIVELEPIFVEKNLHSLKALRENPEDLD